MPKFFRSSEEAFDLKEIVNRGKKKGACRIVVHGSMVGKKGVLHDDVDVYIEYQAEVARSLGCYGLADLDKMRVEVGKRSGEKFDIRESNVPFERSTLGDEYNNEVKPKRVIFGSKTRRESWE
jgi:predicted nucleotidyltransferase